MHYVYLECMKYPWFSLKKFNLKFVDASHSYNVSYSWLLFNQRDGWFHNAMDIVVSSAYINMLNALLKKVIYIK